MIEILYIILSLVCLSVSIHIFAILKELLKGRSLEDIKKEIDHRYWLSIRDKI